MRQVIFTVFCLGRKDTKNIPDTEKKLALLLAGLGEKRITFPFTDSNVEFIETMSENFPMLKDIKFNAFVQKEMRKRWCLFNHLLMDTGTIYLQTIINQGRLYIRPQMNLMEEDVVYLENDDMYKVKEAFCLFWYFPAYLKMLPKENVL